MGGMKEIKLHGKAGEGKFALVDDDMFEYLDQFHWFYSKHGKMYYVTRKQWVGGKGFKKYLTIFMHREVMKAPPRVPVDHGNHITYDNQRSNLSYKKGYSGNNLNRNIAPTRRYKGVVANDGYFVARLGVNNRVYVLGSYTTEEEAAIAYNHALLKFTDGPVVFNPVPNWQNIHPTPRTKNMGITKNNTSGVRGVNFNDKMQRWVARIQIGKKRIVLGSFKTKEEAVKARRDAEHQYLNTEAEQ